MNTVVNQINEKLTKEQIFANVYPTQLRNVVCVNIDGDWKHDHAYAEYLIDEMFPGCIIRTTIVNQDGSDCYEADHYVIVPEDYVK